MRLLILAFALALAGCGTVKQEIAPEPTVSGFCENIQNDGLIGVAYLEDGSFDGFRVTEGWRDRYNALVAKWGLEFEPRLVKDAGLRIRLDGVWVIDAERYAKFLAMVRWEASGKTPPSMLRRAADAVGVTL